MNKYIYSICTLEGWPELHSISASGINEAEEKVISKYCEIYDLNNDDLDYLQFQEMLNDRLQIVISDLYDIEEL